jgi:hypothetical protein
VFCVRYARVSLNLRDCEHDGGKALGAEQGVIIAPASGIRAFPRIPSGVMVCSLADVAAALTVILP